MLSNTVNISISPIERDCRESDVYSELLSLDGCKILELGCGSAELTRQIAKIAKEQFLL